jgi:hypothetical protein
MMLNNVALEHITQLESTDLESVGKAHPEVIEDLQDLGFLFSSTPHGNVATV